MATHSAKYTANQGRGFSRFFNDRKIATKILMGFSVVIAITAIIAGVAYFEFGKIQKDFHGYARTANTLVEVGEIDREFVAFRRYIGEVSDNAEENAASAEKARQNVRLHLAEALKQITEPERLAKAQHIAEKFEVYSKGYEKVLVMRRDIDAIDQLYNDLGTTLRTHAQELQKAAAKAGNSNATALAAEALHVVMQVRFNAEKLIRSNDKRAAESLPKWMGDLKQLYAGLDNAGLGDDGRKVLGESKQMVEKFEAANAKLLSTAKQLDELLNKEMRAAARAIATDAEEMKKTFSAEENETEEEVTKLVSFANTFILGVALFGIVFGVVLAWLIGRIIARPVIALVPELRKLADGDFNITLPGLGRKDEIGEISEAAELVAERVGATIVNIKVTANEVTSASAEISTSTTDLSQRTEEQAASLEETSASMEEMTATVKKNAENAKQASQLASSTREVADRGGEVVAKTVDAMAKIEESSRKISDIIGVIDEIARQTNLLALNAAVEAARAGEAGRGFAVVASEVRSLAQRSSQAAKDIKDLITNSNGQVKDGVELVNRAGKSLNEIVESIKKVTEVVAEIANASMEQSTGIEQINKALTQMDEVTQQNSALVEENAATAKALEEQAKSMDERISIFKVRGDTAETAHRAPPAAERHSASAAAPRQEAAARRPTAAPAKRAAAAPRTNGAAHRGPVGRMQAGLAVALHDEADWKEF